MERPTKYGSIRTNGYASKKEARRAAELKLLEKAGTITNLRFQSPFALWVGDVLIAKYVADFTYVENGLLVVEDAKGVRTPLYKLKKKLMKACYGIEILET